MITNTNNVKTFKHERNCIRKIIELDMMFLMKLQLKRLIYLSHDT